MVDKPEGSFTNRHAPASHERRRWPREAGAFMAAIGRARLGAYPSRYPSLRPDDWYKVIGQNPEALEPLARPGYLWIEVDGRPRRVWAGHFEIHLGKV
jgi:hypothetical protein